MKNLLLFLQKYYYWFVFLLLEVVSCILLFQFNSYQGSVYFTSANELSGYIYDMQSQITSYFSLRQTNRELTEQNVHLNLELGAMRKALAEQKDTALGKSVQMVVEQHKMIPASIVNITLNRKNNYLTINKGESDGVKPEMGVVGGNGLVGIVYQSTAHFSLVMPVLNSKSNISCRIRKRGYFGYLRWDAVDSRYAILEDVPRHAFFRKGDYVETSGFSEVFPEGILVGRIVAVYNSDDGLSYQLKVKLATDFGRLRDVRVISNENNAELKLLQERAKRQEEKEVLR